MRDATRLQGPDLPEGAADQLVGDVVVVEGVEAPAADVLVHEHHGVRTELGGGDQLRRVRPGGDRRVREERLLLQRLPQRDDRPAGGDRPQGDPPPGAVEEAVRLLLAVDDGDVERRPVLQRHAVPAAPVAAVRRVGHALGAQRRHGPEADPAQAGEEGLPGGPHIGGTDRVQRAVRHGPADQDGQDDRERGGVAGHQHGERVEQQHHPERHPPARSSGHPHGGHVRDHRGEVVVHRVGEAAAGLRLGQRVLDRAGRGLGDPEVGGEGDAVRQDGGEDTVRDAQPVTFDQALDGEGDGDEQDGDGGDETGDLDEDIGGADGALVDVLLETRGRRVGERGDGDDEPDGEQTGEQPHQVGRPVDARREQRLVAGDPLGHVSLAPSGG